MIGELRHRKGMMNTTGLVYSPADAGKLAIQALEELRSAKGGGMKTGIPDMDKVLLPLRPGELITVLGYTSWYKSGFMNWLLKASVSQLSETEIVIKVTWEDSVEEETLKWIASDAGISISTLIQGHDTDWTAVMRSYSKRIETPLWIIGHSNSESATQGKARPRLTMTDVMSAVEYICHEATDNAFTVKMICLDYLQRIRPDASDGNNKREQMMEAVNRSKDMAIAMGCPVVLGVQASRAVLEREYKLPRLDDGLETSNIEQSSDKVISLWYPIKTEKEGTLIQTEQVKVTKNLLIAGILKQKMGAAPVVMPLYVDPEKNLIGGIVRNDPKEREVYRG